MEIKEIIKSKNIFASEISDGGILLRKKWEESFADHMNLKEKQEIYLFNSDDGYSGYLWHLFSYEKRDCLKRKEAEIAFEHEPKSSCYIFFQHSDEAFALQNAGTLNPKDLSDESDIYVVDQEFTWTFVITHEKESCGPYFCSR